MKAAMVQYRKWGNWIYYKTTLWYNTKNHGTKSKNDCSVQKVKR